MTGDQAAREVGVRLLAFNRPGYGSSTPTDIHAHLASPGTPPSCWTSGASSGWRCSGCRSAGRTPPRSPRRTPTAPPRSAWSPRRDARRSPGGDRRGRDGADAPEFMAWRAGSTRSDEDDAALAARFLAELPEADAALLRPSTTSSSANLVWDALVEPEGYLRDAALLSGRGTSTPPRCAARRGVGRRAGREGGGRVDVVGRAAPAGRPRGAARHDPPRHAAHPVAGDPPTPRNSDGLMTEGGLRT